MENLVCFSRKEVLAAWLHQVQAQRLTHIALCIVKPLADMCSISRLRELLDGLLPLIQTRSGVVRRERSGAWYVSLNLRYRDGVRLGDAWRAGHEALSNALNESERAALTSLAARIEPLKALPEAERAHELMRLVAGLAEYANPTRGSAEHASVVHALGILQTGKANCQGYSDLFLLAATLAGLTATCQVGWKGREAHLWNLLCLSGQWLIVDVTSGWFGLTQEEARRRGLRWDMDVQP